MDKKQLNKELDELLKGINDISVGYKQINSAWCSLKMLITTSSNYQKEHGDVEWKVLTQMIKNKAIEIKSFCDGVISEIDKLKEETIETE